MAGAGAGAAATSNRNEMERLASLNGPFREHQTLDLLTKLRSIEARLKNARHTGTRNANTKFRNALKTHLNLRTRKANANALAARRQKTVRERERLESLFEPLGLRRPVGPFGDPMNRRSSAIGPTYPGSPYGVKKTFGGTRRSTRRNNMKTNF